MQGGRKGHRERMRNSLKSVDTSTPGKGRNWASLPGSQSLCLKCCKHLITVNGMVKLKSTLNPEQLLHIVFCWGDGNLFQTWRASQALPGFLRKVWLLAMWLSAMWFPKLISYTGFAFTLTLEPDPQERSSSTVQKIVLLWAEFIPGDYVYGELCLREGIWAFLDPLLWGLLCCGSTFR